MTDALTIVPPLRPLRGSVAPPGSKSITNRALLMAALANGTSPIKGALKSDDTRHMAVALRAMGVMVDEPDDTTFIITGTGRLQAPKQPLFLGNAGTATRFLTAAAALVEGTVTVTGDAYAKATDWTAHLGDANARDRCGSAIRLSAGHCFGTRKL